jgi:hypothetical protein
MLLSYVLHMHHLKILAKFLLKGHIKYLFSLVCIALRRVVVVGLCISPSREKH